LNVDAAVNGCFARAFVVNVALAGSSRFDHQCSVHASLVEQPGNIGIFRMSEAGKAEEQKREEQLRH